jgi:branched-chain amino acid transport system ATP-binding protein
MLRVTDLVVRYGDTTIVHGVSFDVPDGRLVALIGPNGAGKTTCFNAINGQIPVHSGKAELDGRSLIGLSPTRIWALGVGRTFQITATIPSMTVRENVQMGLIAKAKRLASVRSAARDLYREGADALLDAVGMAQQAERACGVLAYGDLKRLELAMALTNDPKLLLMDEPTAGMAPHERRQLMDLTGRLCRERNVAVLFTDHDVDVVLAVADSILVLNRGEVVARGLPADIRADPVVQEVYLGGGTTYGAASAMEARALKAGVLS